MNIYEYPYVPEPLMGVLEGKQTDLYNRAVREYLTVPQLFRALIENTALATDFQKMLQELNLG